MAGTGSARAHNMKRPMSAMTRGLLMIACLLTAGSATAKDPQEHERAPAQADNARKRLTLTVRLVASADAERILRELKGENLAENQTRVALRRNASDRDVPAGAGDVAPDAQHYRTKRRVGTHHDVNEQALHVQDGQRAFIRVGQSIPHLTTIRRFSGVAPTVSQGVEFQNVTTGFDVLPRLRGDRVHLTIVPRIASLTDLSTGLTGTPEVASTAVVKLGEWIDLGLIVGNGDEARRAIFESVESTAGERRTILLKVE